MVCVFVSYLEYSFSFRFRLVAGIKPSFYSRVSNHSVRTSLGAAPLNHTLLQYQLNLLGKIARQHEGNVLRNIVFQESSTDLRPLLGRRRKGRPRKTWATELHAVSKRIALREQQNLEDLWANSATAREVWKQAVLQHCMNPA